MDSRQQFEEWQIGKYCGGEDRLKRCSNADEVYYYQEVQLKWVAWQESRESLVIELPSRKWSDADLYIIYGDSEGRGDCLDYDETLQAIHAAGIRTK